MKFSTVQIVGLVLFSMISVTPAIAKSKTTPKKTQKIIKLQKTSTSSPSQVAVSCGPYTASQLKDKQDDADLLIKDCSSKNIHCKESQLLVSKINQSIVNIDAMTFVFGTDKKNREPRKEVIQYATNMIQSSRCFSKKQDRQSQVSFLQGASPNYLFSAAIACQSNIPFFRTSDNVYRATAPLNEIDYGSSLEYTQYLSDQHHAVNDDPWNTVNIPYKITDKYRSTASPISTSDTSRFGYLKSGEGKNAKITPINFEGYKNLVDSASACVYMMNNDKDRSNDDFQTLITRDFGYLVSSNN